MNAPSSSYPDLLAGWRAQIDALVHQLLYARLYRTIFTEVRDALIENDKTYSRPLDGTFIVCFADIYWDSQVLTIRRLLDRDRSTISIPNLCRGLAKNPLARTREDAFADALSRLTYTPDYRDTRQIFANVDAIFEGQDHLDAANLERRVDEILSTAKRLRAQADKWIAHRERAYSLTDHDVRFADIHATLDQLEAFVNELHFVLNGSTIMFNYPRLVQPTWKWALMQPVFEPPPFVAHQLRSRTRPDDHGTQ